MKKIPGEIIKNNELSKVGLMEIFNPQENPIACANYGGGIHCNEEKVDLKIKLLDERAQQSTEDACMLGRILYLGGKPAAMFNIGTSGSPATVLDRNHENSQVYEFSGAMVKDAYFVNGLNENIANDIRTILSNCIAREGYTKAVATFTPSHPYQETLLRSAGCTKLLPDNLENILGINSLHPERFKFEGDQSYECQAWYENASPVIYEGWHYSQPCAEWLEKTIMVIDVNDQHFTPIHDEL